MKLKKMEIIGFKSFVDKASIVFPPGVSAIVGPNGCGKSNIVDALKWGMGEQSVKQLRGKSMDDLIFAGTTGKPALNMAEVSLTLVNDNGNSPEEYKDFDEITLTRRFSRNGESAYLINKRPCRLKDIHNIFLGSGMGAKSYSIIQQGNIGAITDAGPEERRLFIEEAAGITRYKQQKNETIRKIDATNQNLVRVKDIISEVERQMAGVKRQAKKAERYKNYQEHIRKLDILLAFHYSDELAGQIQETAEFLKGLKEADFEHTSKLNKLDAAVEEIKIQRTRKNQEISRQKSDKFETQRKIDKNENDLEHLKKEVERLGNESEELKSAHRHLEEKNKNIQVEIAQVEEENISLKEKIEEVKSVLDKERSDSQAINEQLSKLNMELDVSKKRLDDLTAREAQYKNIYQNASNNKQSLKRRLKRIDEDEAVAGRNVSEGQKNEVKAKQEMEELQQEISDLNSQVSSITAQIEEKTKALGDQVKIVQSLDLDRSKTRSKYSTLKKMEDNFDWYKDGVKAIMKIVDCRLPIDDSNRQSTIFNRQSVIGLMADVLEPEPPFEAALEAVLGESLQYVLVKDRETGLKAIEYLQNQGAGRSGFIPVSNVTPREKVPDRGKQLLKHVSVKPGYEKVAESLLAHVAVAENMEQALKLYNNNGAFQAVVTMNGDVVSQQGVMIGGSKDKLSGILAKKHEIKELEQQIADFDEKLSAARDEQRNLESDVRTIESDLQKLTEKKNIATRDEIDAQKAFYKVTEELKHARRHLEIVQMEQDQLLNEENGIDDEMEKYNKASAEVEEEVKAARDKVAETSEKINTVSSEMNDYNQRVVDLKLQLTSLNARMENSTSSYRRLKEFQGDGAKRLEQLMRDITLKDQKKLESEHKLTEYEKALSRLYEHMKHITEVLDTNEEDFHAIDAKLKESDSSISDIKTRREETVEKIRVLELEQSQRRMKQENISNRIQERYHRPLSDFRSALGNDVQVVLPEKMEEELADYRKKIEKIGAVNPDAIEEYGQLKERYDFLCGQRDDLVKAVEDLHKVIKKINKITQEKFLDTFNLINEKMNEVFPRLFNGGSASLVLAEPNKPLETGVEFMVHPPGKKLTRLTLLSGGEKALSAIAFIFSIFLIKPSSFCIMDEIDAPLDEANVFRFNELLKIIGEQSQIIMITHKKKSMEFADTLFGVTMEKKGISKLVTVNFERKAE
ncbi:MAG: chromosome segregation protein SMC [Desulfobacterales bacterium]|nr:chromosome segregation protein SMC [Desulfobacterales bacterium]